MTVLNPNARPQGHCVEVFRETGWPWSEHGIHVTLDPLEYVAQSLWWMTSEEQGTPVWIASFADAYV